MANGNLAANYYSGMVRSRGNLLDAPDCSMARDGSEAKKLAGESSAITKEDSRTIGMEDAKAAGDNAPSHHWTKTPVESDDPEDIARARRRLTEEIMGKVATKPMQIRGLVCPWWGTNLHPVAALLQQYARRDAQSTWAMIGHWTNWRQ